MKATKHFKEGERVYYIPALCLPGIRGIVVDVEYFAGRPSWLTVETSDGKTIQDYPHMFSRSKNNPYKY